MTAAVATKEATGVTTHGTLNLQFAATGLTAEEFTLKFNQFMAHEFEASLTNMNGEKIQLETFDFELTKLETFQDDEWN